VGYYLQRDEKFDKNDIQKIVSFYKNNPKDGLIFARNIIDEIVNKAF
jgi:hypothetical protein